MQVAKSITVKVSKKINRDKFLSLRNFFNTYQAIARLYYSYILENSLEEKLISGEITSKDLKNILHQKLYRQIRETFDIGSQTVQEIRDTVGGVINSYAQLIRKGEITEKEGKQFIDDLLKKSEQAQNEMEVKIYEMIKDSIKKLNLATAEDVAQLHLGTQLNDQSL